ncbi:MULTISPECIES: ureidoglycolate lyase [unclassified Acinetobacter]|uniref:ureidoglycolate lyase n=1 Tax=unclassified Acinetobacter TaxID=196816 RepID=UPI00244C3340|nr:MULTISPECIES: ureidoglycolate lyase [unclassified Acinetobacter]MDH0030114.1 ureidoglycolate lyase [Acinetobacter sp. GD04021]MDH0885054.1 ureidoglycolate lyase [Acinetobacter sp. GD03873]MDH1082302.1 ureidoglycolate lyase [Acinetobacter sp. GD03983]MDH2188505.1 ureidoglycolate lyase [Acinetobacter sp. GD03645]MDH2201972.1 ureidoglycolate lyase [Acinetobacter sp. GD03647]
MYEKNIQIQPLTQESFAPFGDVIEKENRDCFPINNGLTERYHALSLAQVSGDNVAVGMSIFHNLAATELPFQIEMLERHPYGSQSFIPLQQQKFVIVVALPLDHTQPDEQQIFAFLSNGKQGVNYHQGVWHHPLLTLEANSDFLVIDRIGGGQNCDMYQLSNHFMIVNDR